MYLYAFFHLNLMFSSVEEEQRPHVVERCYWPLLRLARRHNLPLGIESSACTLQLIKGIDPTWIDELRDLIHEGPCDFIGSGYAQLIGPLVPAAVNRENLCLGMKVYQSILGFQPTIALVNEQAYSSGLVPLYKEAGYETLIMEWNNSARSHQEWDAEMSYHPQRAIGVDGGGIGLIWNNSIAFQKFQRYAHSELELEELLNYIRGHVSKQSRFFSIYGNDAEIFDFRPGRFMTEAPLHSGEWDRIESLVEAIESEAAFSWIPLSALQKHSDAPHAGHLLRLESVDQPIPVKKQDKYNVLRWALTGRDDLLINSRCHRLHQTLLSSPYATDEDWQELCFLWSSDFRTHITSSRWLAYQQRLASFEKQWPASEASFECQFLTSCDLFIAPPKWSRQGRWLTVTTEHLELRFNCRRGLALEYFIDSRLSSIPLFGTLHHGYFDDISWGADYYSGHLVFQKPGSHQITDLQAVEPSVQSEGSCLVISTIVATPLGPIHKTWTLNAENHALHLSIQLNWPEAGLGRLHLVPITLFPEAFNADTLQVSAANGGAQHECFPLNNHSVDHGKAVSFLVSAHQALGLTDGLVLIGDVNKTLDLRFNPADTALLGQIQHQPVDNKWFTRLCFSARELDDTSKQHGLSVNFNCSISSSNSSTY